MNSFSARDHGGEVYALARRMHTTTDKLLDFSSNANVFALSLTESLVRATPYPFLHYPDTGAEELKESIAAHEGVDTLRILPGNGGAELIWLALRFFSPRKALFLGPVFSEYIAACHAGNIPYEILTPPAENFFTCTPDNLRIFRETDADLVVLCSPNNPAAVTYENILPLLRLLRAPRVLIDNSYREFLYGTDEYPANCLHAYLAAARSGVSLFTLHSFTKFFCCPGIRLGYLLGDRTQIARMAALRPSWTVSPFAQVMGRIFLARIDSYRETLPALRKAVAHLGRELRRLPCVHPERVFEGPGFLCCGLSPRLSAAKVRDALLKRLIVVRDCDPIPGMPCGYIRVQARPEEDSARLLQELDALFSPLQAPL